MLQLSTMYSLYFCVFAHLHSFINVIHLLTCPCSPVVKALRVVGCDMLSGSVRARLPTVSSINCKRCLHLDQQRHAEVNRLG